MDHPFDRLEKDYVLFATACERDEIDICKAEALEYVRKNHLDFRHVKISVKKNEDNEYFVLVLKR